MTNYRRSFIAGASYFFTVNLAERSSRLLIEHIDWLREAIYYTGVRGVKSCLLPGSVIAFSPCRDPYELNLPVRCIT
jgi:hypothetical protein